MVRYRTFQLRCSLTLPCSVQLSGHGHVATSGILIKPQNMACGTAPHDPVGTAGTTATDITGLNNAPAVNTAYPANDVYDFGTPTTGPPNDQYYACWAFNPSAYSAYTLTLGFFTMFCLTPS